MSTQPINDGGPAFPCAQRETHEGWHGASDGMSLRDYLAAQAMQALLYAIASHGVASEVPNVAASAYEMADSMLAARSKS